LSIFFFFLCLSSWEAHHHYQLGSAIDQEGKADKWTSDKYYLFLLICFM
jgi:hypothetical protein